MRLTFIHIFVVLAFLSCKTKKTVTSSYVPPKTNTVLSADEDKDFQFMFFNANKEKLLGNYSLAATLFQQCIKLNPNTPAPYYEMANIYSLNNEKDKAIEYSSKAAAMDPKNIWYQLLYADCLLERKKLNEAAVVYQTILKYHPEKMDLNFELANIYLQAGKPAEAIKVYDRIEEKIGVNDEGNLQKVRIYNQQKNEQMAMKELNKLIAAFPNESRYSEILAAMYEDKGQFDKALGIYNELLKKDPENPHVHSALGGFYGMQKQTDKALQEYLLVIKSNRLDIDSKMKIILNYYDLSAFRPELKPDALSLTKALVEAHPTDAKSHAVLGDVLYRDKKLAEARDSYRKANQFDKSKYAIWSQILIIDSEMNDYDAMLQESKETMELFPSQPLGYLFNGIANIQKKNYSDAITSLNEGKEYVVENKALSSQFYASLGDSYHQVKNYVESDKAYDKALEIDPKNVFVLNNYAYYLSLRNEKLEKAEAMSKKTNELVPDNDSYLDTYGWILYQMKKHEEAKKWIGQAIEHGGKDNSVILEHYGDVLFQLGEKEKALEYWQNAQKKGAGSDFLDKKVADKKLYE